MQTIIQKALSFKQNGEYPRPEDSDYVGAPRIIAVGVGNAGCETIQRLYHLNVHCLETIAVNTDKEQLETIQADKRVLIGKSLTKGFGAGGFPDIGKRAAEMGRSTLEQLLEYGDLVFVTAGMGGGTGTGAAPVIAQVAKDQGAIVVGMVSSPFKVEKARLLRAEEGLEALGHVAGSVIVLDSNRMATYVDENSILDAFIVKDQLIAETIKYISEFIFEPAIISIDFADVRVIMSRGGIASMFIGESKFSDPIESIVDNCLNNTVYDADYRNATGCLIIMIGGSDTTVGHFEEIADSIKDRIDPDADVYWPIRISSEYEGKILIITILTGIPDSSGGN